MHVQPKISASSSAQRRKLWAKNDLTHDPRVSTDFCTGTSKWSHVQITNSMHIKVVSLL